MSVVFVFGSNLAGRHGKGAALEAVNKWDAEYGKGIGRVGDSYAIPTKDQWLNVLSLDEIRLYVHDFRLHAMMNPKDKFIVTAIGTGLAGYTVDEIAPMFKGMPENVYITAKLFNKETP